MPSVVNISLGLIKLSIKYLSLKHVLGGGRKPNSDFGTAHASYFDKKKKKPSTHDTNVGHPARPLVQNKL